MLECLYKGKSNGIWMEGYYVQVLENIENGSSSCLKVKHFIYVNNFSNMGNYELTRFEIDGKTLCQSIGIIDKNNKTIFEKDIVCLKVNNKEYKAKVVLDEYGVKFVVLNEENLIFTIKDINSKFDISVISNIFDI